MIFYKTPRIIIQRNRFIRPIPPIPKLPKIIARSNILDTLSMSTKIVGDAIGTYVLMFCTLQWWWYKTLNEQIENDEKD